MKHQIYYTKPSITGLEVQYAADAAANGWGEHCYDYIVRFEHAFAAHLGVDYAIATSSCTGALHMGMSALGIGRGDEVILADSNWVATAAPIVHLGATPVFIDILPDTWCMDPALVEAAITPRTKAIVAVHLYGNLCEMDRLLAIGERHGIPVIEDAAEAIGSVYHGRRAGSIGRFGTFSFHGSKTMTTGEGGMFVTNDRELYDRVLTLSYHGRAKGQKRQFWPEIIGFKYKMSNIDAAIGFAQIKRIDHLIARKREIFQYYKNKLLRFNSLAINPEPTEVEIGCWMPTVVFPKGGHINRTRMSRAFSAAGIDARQFFWPLSSTPPFGSGAGAAVARDIGDRAINLPSYHDMTDRDQDKVVKVIEDLLSEEIGAPGGDDAQL